MLRLSPYIQKNSLRIFWIEQKEMHSANVTLYVTIMALLTAMSITTEPVLFQFIIEQQKKYNIKISLKHLDTKGILGCYLCHAPYEHNAVSCCLDVAFVSLEHRLAGLKWRFIHCLGLLNMVRFLPFMDLIYIYQRQNWIKMQCVSYGIP